MNSRIPSSTRWMVFCLVLLGTPVLDSVMPAQRTPAQNPGFPAPPSNQQQRAAVLKMRVEGERVTADITDCPMQKALEELAERTGIIFEVRSQNNPIVSVHLNRVPLQEAIQRIASGCNTMFFYGRGQQETERLTMVRVLPRTNPIQQPGIVYLGTGAVTKSSEDIETPEQALKALEGSANIEVRERAIEVLVNAKGDAAHRVLMGFLFDPAPEIRVAVIEGLAASGAHDALPGILKSLKDAHPGVRQSAATAVALLGDARNLRDLKPLTADKDASVAAAAELAMRKLSATGRR